MILWKLMEGLCRTPWEGEKAETRSHLSEESTSLLQAGHTHWKQIIRAEGPNESKSQEATVKPMCVLWAFVCVWLSSLDPAWGFSHIWKAACLLSSQRLTEELCLGHDSRNLRPPVMPCFWPSGLLGWLSGVPQALLIETLFFSHSLSPPSWFPQSRWRYFAH